jgi:hypothetical protein
MSEEKNKKEDLFRLFEMHKAMGDMEAATVYMNKLKEVYKKSPSQMETVGKELEKDSSTVPDDNFEQDSLSSDSTN